MSQLDICVFFFFFLQPPIEVKTIVTGKAQTPVLITLRIRTGRATGMWPPKVPLGSRRKPTPHAPPADRGAVVPSLRHADVRRCRYLGRWSCRALNRIRRIRYLVIRPPKVGDFNPQTQNTLLYNDVLAST